MSESSRMIQKVGSRKKQVECVPGYYKSRRYRESVFDGPAEIGRFGAD